MLGLQIKGAIFVREQHFPTGGEVLLTFNTFLFIYLFTYS